MLAAISLVDIPPAMQAQTSGDPEPGPRPGEYVFGTLRAGTTGLAG